MKPNQKKQDSRFSQIYIKANDIGGGLAFVEVSHKKLKKGEKMHEKKPPDAVPIGVFFCPHEDLNTTDFNKAVEILLKKSGKGGQVLWQTN